MLVANVQACIHHNYKRDCRISQMIHTNIYSAWKIMDQQGMEDYVLNFKLIYLKSKSQTHLRITHGDMREGKRI